jgi:hypothetical protein
MYELTLPSTDQIRAKSIKTMLACVVEWALANFAEAWDGSER